LPFFPSAFKANHRNCRVFDVTAFAAPCMTPSYFVVARSRNFTSAARSCSEPMRCSGILVPGV
jgi:hypothetical protein